jgi:hypothetical protein
MRIPFPEHVPLKHVIIFVGVLVTIQLLEGTELYFSLGCAAFILIAAIAFNLGGGLTRTSGAYVFFYAMLVVIIGICYKAVLREPAQSHLQDPVTDIEVYVGGITAMLAAVIVSRRFSRKQGLLQNILKESQMYRASVGCLVVGVFGRSAILLLGQSGTPLLTAFDQLNQLVPLGIIIGAMYEIRRSGGNRSANGPMIMAGAYSVFIGGVLFFSKQAFLTPPLAWFLPVCALRFRISTTQILVSCAAAFIMFYYLFPFSQYGRSQATDTMSQGERMDVALSLLEQPQKTRELYLQQSEILEQNGIFYGGYYDKQQGFFDRLQFVSVDDSLVTFTQKGDRTVGLGPVLEAFANAVPRVIWHNKPPPHFSGNFYSHEMGGLADEDATTGISFSPTSEAFHMEKWLGVLFVAPLLWFLTFVVFDSLFGDLRATPWGLLVLVQLSHVAPEAGLSGLIHFLTFGVEIMVFCALFATHVAPVFAIPVLGPDRRKPDPRFSLESDRAHKPVLQDPA